MADKDDESKDNSKGNAKDESKERAKDDPEAGAASDGGGDGGSNDEGSGRSNGRPRARELVEGARDELVAITGRPAYGVSGLTATDDGWMVRVDLVELERIPPSTSVLASYEVELDGDGNLVGYERTRRFHLSQTDG